MKIMASSPITSWQIDGETMKMWQTLFSWLQPPSAVILEPRKIKSVTVFIFSTSICHEMMRLDAMILVFSMLTFKSVGTGQRALGLEPDHLSPLSSFTLIKRLFSSSSLSVIKVVSTAYLTLLVFLPAILIPACASSRPAFHMMHSAYKLNKQGDKIQSWSTPFPTLNQSIVPCLVRIVSS